MKKVKTVSRSVFTAPRLSFMGAPRATLETLNVSAAVFAAPHGMPYEGVDNRGYAATANAMRKAIALDGEWTSHWDWDLDGPVFSDPAFGHRDFSMADLGDLKTIPNGGHKAGLSNYNLIEETTRAILRRGAVPLMIGGDDSVPIPFLHAFSETGPITILQIDAHIDWRDERLGEKLGFSSTMRRASEMKHVERIVQVGTRGLGSARQKEVEFARAWGAKIFPARHVHHNGLTDVLAAIPPGSRVVIALDLDVIDGATMPGVAYPSPGGLSYQQVIDLFAGLAARARIAGLDMVEFMPKRDLNGYSASSDHRKFRTDVRFC
jgi:agmatinase